MPVGLEMQTPSPHAIATPQPRADGQELRQRLEAERAARLSAESELAKCRRDLEQTLAELEKAQQRGEAAISDRKHLEERFRHTQKIEAIGRLAGGIAHDFNNLLSVVMSYSSLLIADLSLETRSARTWKKSRQPASAPAISLVNC